MRGGVLACALLLAGSSARAEMTVTILSPPSGGVRDQSRSFPVIVRVESALFPSSVRAQILTRAVDLSYDGTGTLWRADFDAADLPAGTTTVTVSATAPGDSGMAEQTFVLDRSPQIQITAPLEGAVAQPSIHVRALCVRGAPDSADCTALDLYLYGGPLLASSRGSLDEVVSLSAYEGTAVLLALVARTTRPEITASSTIQVYVDSSPRLVPVQSVDGTIVDFDATRILFRPGARGLTILDLRGLTIRDRASLVDTPLTTGLAYTPHLTPRGAIWHDGEFRDGKVIAGPAHGLLARGGYAVWQEDSRTFAYYDIVAGTTTSVQHVYDMEADDVAANGDVVITSGPESLDALSWVYRYRDGVFTRAPSCPTRRCYRGRTDGIVVAFGATSGVGNNGYISLWDETGRVLVLDYRLGLPPQADQDYQVSGGWAAFTHALVTFGPLQIWTRSPAGDIGEASFFNSSSTIEALSGSGEVMLFNTSDGVSARYLGRAGMLPDRISHTLGRAVWFGDAWYVVMGGTLLAVTPKGGVIDGGVDAGRQAK